MLSISLTRSLATLGVIAGLLAVAGPASGSAAKPSGSGGIVTDNKDPDKVSGALVAADFDYKEATGSTRPHADGGVLGFFFDIPAELLHRGGHGGVTQVKSGGQSA
jgi:hypothetical protein